MTRPSSSRPLRAAVLGLGALALAALSQGQPQGQPQAQPPRPEKAKLSVLADRTAYEAGSTAKIGARVSIEPGWHVNSHTPTFDYLIPTQLDLELPAGWPDETVRYPVSKMQTFAFED